MLPVDDNPHGQLGTAQLGRDGRIRVEPSTRPLRGSGEGGSLRLYRAGAEGPALPSPQQGAERHRAAVSGQAQWLESRPADAADPALDGAAADRAEAGAAAEFPATLHGRRHRLAGRGRRGPRGSVRPGDATPAAAGVRGLRGRAVPATGGHLGLAHLQPAELGRLRQAAGAGPAHASPPGRHWGASPAEPERETRLPSSLRKHQETAGDSGPDWPAARPAYRLVPKMGTSYDGR